MSSLEPSVGLATEQVAEQQPWNFMCLDSMRGSQGTAHARPQTTYADELARPEEYDANGIPQPHMHATSQKMVTPAKCFRGTPGKHFYS